MFLLKAWAGGEVPRRERLKGGGGVKDGGMHARHGLRWALLCDGGGVDGWAGSGWEGRFHRASS